MIGEIGELLVKLVSRSRAATDASVFALATVAEKLALAINHGLADSFHEVASQYKRRMEARTQGEESEAKKRALEAVKAANEENERHELHEAQLERKRLENAALQVEVDAKELKNEQQARKMALAELRLQDALTRLKLEGGNLFLDEGNLEELKTLAPKKRRRKKLEKDSTE